MDKKQEFMTNVYNKLGLELNNEKYNFLGVLHIAESYKNEKDCYLHYLIKLHDECLKLDLDNISPELLNVIDEVNGILNADTSLVSNLPLDSRNN